MSARNEFYLAALSSVLSSIIPCSLHYCAVCCGQRISQRNWENGRLLTKIFFYVKFHNFHSIFILYAKFFKFLNFKKTIKKKYTIENYSFPISFHKSFLHLLKF